MAWNYLKTVKIGLGGACMAFRYKRRAKKQKLCVDTFLSIDPNR